MFIIGTPHARGAGYLLNNRDDPSSRVEADMQTCTHCQAAINLQEWQRKGAWCNRCMAPICLSCGKRMQTFGCEPFMQKLEAFARQQEKLVAESPVPLQLILTGK
jgi:hypothetical protein